MSLNFQLPPRTSLQGQNTYQQAAPAIPPRVSSPSSGSIGSCSSNSLSQLPQSNSTGSLNQVTKAFLEAEGIQLRKKNRNQSGDLIDLSNGADE